MPVAAFPGVYVIAAGGHTPGSQIIIARVRRSADESAVTGERLHVMTGDIVNHLEGIRGDIAKPFLYRLLVVPEDDERQGELRRFLRGLEQRGATLLVSHDQSALEQSGIPSWDK